MNKAWMGVVLASLALGVTAAPKKAAPPAKPVVIEGSVSRVVDGDTLWLKAEGDGEPPVVVRIEGIDAPESCQPGGAEATAALTALALGRKVSVRVVARDEHGRVIGKVLDGQRDLGDRMVRDGQAWSSRYQYDRGPYVSEERMALALKRGLHAAGGAIQPRDFRKQHGPCEGGASKPAAAAAAPVAAFVAVAFAAKAARCDGRQYCSQMSSCAEATWFLNNCAGVKMDSDRDGVPCEQQWCRK